jgi:beta-N-acetylhexosaminidase
MFQKFLLSYIFLIFSCLNFVNAQPANKTIPLPPLQSEMNVWVDSIYNSLTIDQRIGQLYMIAAYSGGEKYNQPLIEKLIRENSIGGLIFMQGTPKAQIEQTNRYQSISKTPLLIAMDAEWGLGMRLTGVRDFPRQLMLGAMKDSTLVYKMAAAIASQCRRMGVHIDFAPVIDINNNPNNPVINFRSFGENKQKVSNYGIQYMRGLQDNGVMACAKHFPGHGDTDVDSHKDLPEISKSYFELEKLELYPFKQLIANGIQSMMIAHLQIPSLDNREHTPSTLSEKTITDLLKMKMGFNGLIFTDALNMQGVAKYYQPGEIDLKAFGAGNDMLLFSQDVPSGIAKIKEALKKGTISDKRIEESVKKILRAKYNAGLNKLNKLNPESIDQDLNQYIPSIRKQVAEAAITLLSDPYQIIDNIKRNAAKSIVYVGVGTTEETSFTKSLKDYGVKKIFFAPTNEKEIKDFTKRMKNADAVIIGIHKTTGYPTQNFGLDKTEIQVIQELAKNKNTISVLFGNPYAVKNFCNAEGILVAYDEADETQSIAALIVTGQLKAKGRLPVTICDNFKAGDGIVSLTNTLGEVVDSTKFVKQNKDVNPINKAPFIKDIPLECCVSPMALGININDLDRLDDFLANAIRIGAFPGCRVLAAKDGKVFYDKAFGHLTQDRRNSVDINTMYDIASVTKVAATTMAIMKLYDQGKIDLNDYLGKYLRMTKGTDKEYLKLKDILTHQAGLKSWVPFYKETLDSTKYPRADIYSKSMSGKYSIKVSNNLYMRSDWVDTMFKRIMMSPLENRGKYVYSDLDFILLQKVAETITKKPLDEYVSEEFYKPLGMNSTSFNPYKKLPGKEIAPTEYDDYFRHQIIQGYVHDMGAAMFGGVSGHAGLFSTPNDLGTLFQMLLNGGIYNGKRYFQKSTVDLFTSKYSLISRRGLGFDKPEPNANKGNPCSDNASLRTFGHQGFTGTCVWADPEQGLLFIFLSNRTYPSAENKLINKLDVREKSQSILYSALGIAPRARK